MAKRKRHRFKKDPDPKPLTDAAADKEVNDFLIWAHDKGWTRHGTVFRNAAGQEAETGCLVADYSIAVAKGYRPVNKEFLRLAADDVAKRFPDNWGFMLIAAPVGEGGRTTYTANIPREDAIKNLKELLFHWGEAEEWMKHVK